MRNNFAKQPVTYGPFKQTDMLNPAACFASLTSKNPLDFVFIFFVFLILVNFYVLAFSVSSIFAGLLRIFFKGSAEARLLSLEFHVVLRPIVAFELTFAL